MPVDSVYEGFPQPFRKKMRSTDEPMTPPARAASSIPLPFGSPPTPPSKLQKSKSNNSVTSVGQQKHDAVFSFHSSDLVEWMDNYLAVNEVLYPPIAPPGASTPSQPLSPDLKSMQRSYNEEWVSSKPLSPHAGGRSMFGADSADDEGPTRKFIDLSSLKDFRPFVVIKRQHLLMHIITPDGMSSPRAPVASTTGSLFGLSNLSISNGGQKVPESEPMVLSPASSTPLGSDDPGDGVVSYEEGDDRKPKGRDKAADNGEPLESNLEENARPIEIPPLYIQSCDGTSLYLLGSYAFAVISNCNNCDIVIGAVAGIVRVVGCENLKLTVVCKKLILISCLECTINIACSQPVLLVGENKGIVVGMSVSVIYCRI
jgi:hypothetical protein